MKCMKAPYYRNFTFATIVALFASCSNSDDTMVACTAELKSYAFNFKIIDKSNGRDLFFGDPPAYSTDVLVVSMMRDNSMQKLTLESKTEDSKGKYFSTTILPVDKLQTLVVKIADLPADTLKITNVQERDVPCPQWIAGDVVFNGVESASNPGDRVVSLEK